MDDILSANTNENEINFIVEKLIKKCTENDKEICFVGGDGEKFTWYDYLTNVMIIAHVFKKLELTYGDYIYIDNNLTYLTTPCCHFIMMACLYCGICIISGDHLNVKTNKQFIMDNYKYKIEFIIENNTDISFLFKNPSEHDMKNIHKYFPQYNGNETISFNELLKIEVNEYVIPCEYNTNEYVFILTTDITQNTQTTESTKDIKERLNINDKIIKINGKKINEVIQLVKSNYDIKKGAHISHSILTTFETIIFDLYFHMLTNSTLYFLDRNPSDYLINKISEIKPIFIHGDYLVWMSIYKEMHDIVKRTIQNTFMIYVIDKILKIITQINFFCYSYDLEYDKSSIIKLMIMFCVTIVHLFTKKILGFYKKFSGLENCNIFINYGKKIDVNILNYFYSVDIPINYIFSHYSNNTYNLISLTNKYEPFTIGHLTCKAIISNDGYLLIKNENKKNINEYVNTNHKAEILNNGKLILNNN